MQRFTLSKFYRPENVVEHAVSRVKECGGTLDKIRYPKLGDEDGAIWVTFTKDGMPDVFRISKGPSQPSAPWHTGNARWHWKDEFSFLLVS